MTPATARPQAGRSGALPGCQGCHSTWMKCACPAQHFHFKHCSLAVRCRARARSLAGTLQACTLQPGSSRPVTQRDSGRDTRGAPCRPWTGRPGRRRRQGTCASRGRARRCAAPPRPPARRPSARPRRDVAALVCTQSLSLPFLALPCLAFPCLALPVLSLLSVFLSCGGDLPLIQGDPTQLHYAHYQRDNLLLCRNTVAGRASRLCRCQCSH